MKFQYQDRPGVFWWGVITVLSFAAAVNLLAGFGSPVRRIPVAIALLIGPWQFCEQLLYRSYRLHRWAGWVYFAAVAAAAIAAATSERTATDVFAAFWFGTAWVAFETAWHTRIALHRRWTVRNYSLTFAAVTLPIELTFLPFSAAVWLCWIPNLALAEWLIRRKRRSRRPRIG